MSRGQVYTVSITKRGGGEIEFMAVLDPSEADTIRRQIRKQYEADVIEDGGVLPANSDQYLSYERAMARLAPK